MLLPGCLVIEMQSCPVDLPFYVERLLSEDEIRSEVEIRSI